MTNNAPPNATHWQSLGHLAAELVQKLKPEHSLPSPEQGEREASPDHAKQEEADDRVIHCYTRPAASRVEEAGSTAALRLVSSPPAPYEIHQSSAASFPAVTGSVLASTPESAVTSAAGVPAFRSAPASSSWAALVIVRRRHSVKVLAWKASPDRR